MIMIRNNIKYIFLGLIIVLPAFFNSESYLFIRYYSLLGSLAFLILYLREGKRFINMPAFIILAAYVILCAMYYNFSANSYNVRMHFVEYGFYIVIMLITGSIDWDREKLFGILSHAVIVSGLIQFAYSLNDLTSRSGRIQGNTVYPNFLALLLLTGAIAAVFLFIHYYIRQRKYRGLIYIVPFILLIFGTFRTGSRNIIVLLPIAVFIIIFLFRKKWAFIGLFATLIIIMLMPSHSKQRLLHERQINPYGVQRINIYKQVANIALRHPLGIGFNNLQYYTLKNNFPVEGRVGRYAANAKIAHNEYLEWIANAGIAGVALIAVIIIYLILFLKNGWEAHICKKFVISLMTVFAVMAVFDNVLYLPYNAVIFFFLLGIIMNSMKRSNKPIYTFALIFILFILFSADIADIYAQHRVDIINSNLNNENVEETEYMHIADELTMLHVLSGNPQFIETYIDISEILFNRTNGIEYFQNMLDGYNILLMNCPMEYRYYLGYAELLKKYRYSILRMNENIQEKINQCYVNAIELNPYNPFIRYEFAQFLLSEGDTAAAVSQISTAVENEPNFIRGVSALNNITGNKLYERQLDSIYNNYKNLSDNAVTDYERMLIK